jgi:hypothetical protein
MPRKQAISFEQCCALQNWAHQQHPKPSQKACIEWFLLKYQRKLSQSTVSESLSSHFSRLDKIAPVGQWLWTGQWPDLEKVLYDWQQRIESQGGFTTGDILREKAQEIWKQLPEHLNQPCPDFSSGWLKGFKYWHNIKLHVRHGEAGSVPDFIEEEMKVIQEIAAGYAEEDIYNMNETGLFWKIMPSCGLSSQSLSGLKKDKTWITLVFCVNATGLDRFPVWIIGKAWTPCALRNINISTLGAEWGWNQKAWMNTIIINKWLHAFYQHIGPVRQVLLMMDNFHTHLSSTELTPPLSNIRIC